MLSHGPISASGFSPGIADWFEHYQSFNQLDAQQITEADIHRRKDIGWKFDNYVSTAVARVLAFNFPLN
jgi:hypothetical protein